MNSWWTTNTRFAEFMTNCETDPDWEPFFGELEGHFRTLYEIATSCETYIEGSLYNNHNCTVDDVGIPFPKMLGKRRNYSGVVLTGESLLEIGFNAGHSALLALTSNPRPKYTSVDLGEHAYTQPCFDYLKSVFGNRINMFVGDSRNVLPKLPILSSDKFDIWHIDGGHSWDIAEADLCNVLNIGSPGQLILFDDTSAKYLRGMCDYYILRGYVTKITPGWWWEDEHQLLLRIEKPVSLGF